MENPVLNIRTESDITLARGSEAHASLTESNSDPFIAKHLTWSTRFNCIEGYMCVFMSFVSALKFCKGLGEFGFLIFVPFGIYNVFMGAPAVLVEILCGRYAMGYVSKAWTMCPAAKGVLFCLMSASMMSIVQNSVNSLYLLKYFFSSFHEKLTWCICAEPWAKINCYEIGRKRSAILTCYKNKSEDYCTNLDWESSGTQFWKYEIRNTNIMKENIWSGACLFASIILAAIINIKGIRSIEKATALLVYCPIVLGIILAFTTLSLPNALFGLRQLWRFDWALLLEPQIWIEGFDGTLIFLGLGRLSLSFVSSHGRFTDDIIIDLLIITCGGFISCILMTMPLLSVAISTKYLDSEMGDVKFFEDIEDVFVSMSVALQFYPYPQSLWSIINYFNWFLISFGLQVVLILAVCECVVGLYEKVDNFYYILGIISVVSFTLGVLYVLSGLEYKIELGTVIATIILLSTITWQAFYGIERLNNDFYFMMGYPLPIFLKFTWFTLLIFPAILLALKLHYRIPNTPLDYIVFIYSGIPVFIYLLSIAMELIKNGKNKIIKVFTADPNWGPDNTLLKESRIIFDTGNVTKEFMYRQELYKKPFIKPPDFSDQNIVQLV